MPETLVTIGRRPPATARWLPRARRATQLAAMALLGQWSFHGIFRCPFIVPYVSCTSCPVLTCHGRLLSTFWGFWLALPFAVLLFGRAFCGWLCPGGLVNGLLAKLAPLRPRATALLASVAMTGGAAGLAWAGWAFYTQGQKRAAVPIRVGGFLESVALTFEHASPPWLVRTWVVLGLLACGIVVAHCWCRFACPTGGALELVRRFSLFGFVRGAGCNDCDACRRACELGTRPDEAGCTSCGSCRSACPTDVIRFGGRWRS